ncbi:MAG: polysaccharide biosynthesis C-terminal domain-containing protein, partial [Chitinophagales bacterium]
TPYSGYSMQVFLLSLISFMAVQADRFIIASVLDVASVTIYTIITKPYFVLRGVTSISFPVIQPMLTRLNLEKDKTAYFNFTGKVIRTAFLFMLSITLLTAIFYNQVLTLWLGTDIYNIYIKWGILSLAGLCISMLYTPFYRTLLHSNYIRIIVKFSLISVLINVILSITLSKLLGFQGVIIGTLVQIICEFIFSYTLFYKKFEYPVKFTKINKGFLLLVVCLIAIAFGINYLVANYAHNLTLQAILFVGFLGLLSFISYKIIKTENIFGQFSSVQHKPASDIVT